MKVCCGSTFCAVLLLACTGLQFVTAQSSDDRVVQRFLTDRRYALRQIRCVLRERPCDSVGRTFQQVAPLVFRTRCSQCNLYEKLLVTSILNHVQYNFPNEWSRLNQMYG